jgi:hypothetical protein
MKDAAPTVVVVVEEVGTDREVAKCVFLNDIF